MSPKAQTNTPQQDTYSPWTDCFQSNPLHSNGEYPIYADVNHNNSQEPTHEALSTIYDTDYRHN